MKFNHILIATSLLVSGSAALGQQPLRAPPGKAVKVAVVEFTPGSNAAVMNDRAKRLLHTALSASLHNTRKFDVYDTRHTHNASKSKLPAINQEGSTAAAVSLGKQLGVSYVLTGVVTRYEPKGNGEIGETTIRTRVVDVATGKVKHEGETVQKGNGKMNTTGEVEMQAKVMKPAIDAITTTLFTAM
jgi:curli biogenesis system outer membrane secretion channel CsgG